jgi:N-methylhydantoinase B
VSAPGKALPLATGLSGGLPAGTQQDVLLRGTGVRATLADGRVPASLDDIGGARELVPAHHETDLGPDDVYFTHWQGGGGYGDALLRDPAAVAADVAARKVSARAAADVYGVSLAPGGAADLTETESNRVMLRRRRAGLEDTKTAQV